MRFAEPLRSWTVALAGKHLLLLQENEPV